MKSNCIIQTCKDECDASKNAPTTPRDTAGEAYVCTERLVGSSVAAYHLLLLPCVDDYYLLLLLLLLHDMLWGVVSFSILIF